MRAAFVLLPVIAVGAASSALAEGETIEDTKRKLEDLRRQQAELGSAASSARPAAADRGRRPRRQRTEEGCRAPNTNQPPFDNILAGRNDKESYEYLSQVLPDLEGTYKMCGHVEYGYRSSCTDADKPGLLQQLDVVTTGLALLKLPPDQRRDSSGFPLYVTDLGDLPKAAGIAKPRTADGFVVISISPGATSRAIQESTYWCALEKGREFASQRRPAR